MDYPESNVQNEQHSATPVPSESMMQLATIIAQVMGDAQNKSAGSKEEEGDKHLQTFHKLKPPLFKGAVGPQAAEDWLLRIEKIFDSMQCPESRKVPLAVFLFEGKMLIIMISITYKNLHGESFANTKLCTFFDNGNIN
ncbi:hypothetical protein IEQ34_001737 [Dendrobium chrysotoxum]|uniref:Uncharacterized protein n=1 Tax=Dendrobium chrysotoxum TaxID=161865 RepID=A0AAV7HQW9_DENCH|nr:hypothetical protein IEQ34_001737 [Dendrobium chrysotoxum]